MSKLLLKLNVGLVIIAVGGCVINARSSVFIVDDDFTIFVSTILRLLYKEEVHVASNIICGGFGQCDALHEGMRSRGGTTGAS